MTALVPRARPAFGSPLSSAGVAFLVPQTSILTPPSNFHPPPNQIDGAPIIRPLPAPCKTCNTLPCNNFEFPPTSKKTWIPAHSPPIKLSPTVRLKIPGPRRSNSALRTELTRRGGHSELQCLTPCGSPHSRPFAPICGQSPAPRVAFLCANFRAKVRPAIKQNGVFRARLPCTPNKPTLESSRSPVFQSVPNFQAYRLLPTAYCLPPTAYCLLPTLPQDCFSSLRMQIYRGYG